MPISLSKAMWVAVFLLIVCSQHLSAESLKVHDIFRSNMAFALKAVYEAPFEASSLRSFLRTLKFGLSVAPRLVVIMSATVLTENTLRLLPRQWQIAECDSN